MIHLTATSISTVILEIVWSHSFSRLLAGKAFDGMQLISDLGIHHVLSKFWLHFCVITTLDVASSNSQNQIYGF